MCVFVEISVDVALLNGANISHKQNQQHKPSEKKDNNAIKLLKVKHLTHFC